MNDNVRLYERRPVASLIAHTRNARRHTDAQVAQVAESIRAFGFNAPVLIDESSTIIAGHCRVMAAKSLGMESVPCVIVDDLDDAQKRAYVLADNKLTDNSDWDAELLRLEIEDLQLLGVDMGLVGFAPDELQRLFGEQPEPGPSRIVNGDEFLVIVSCANESEQQRLYAEMQERGLQTRIVT